jgi:diadenosine tetraphosphate (Ap4A) HIT family hydrolase/RimJ/RimL family protein N-acetyltransferase
MMNFTFKKMTQQQAEVIASWKYDGIFAFYDMTADEEDYKEFIDPALRSENYFAVFKEEELAGFFCYQRTDGNFVEIGLGMSPLYTGQGNGATFIKAGLEFGQSYFNPGGFCLSVATFNERAIKVYKKLGFKETESFMQSTNGSEYPFIKMELPLYSNCVFCHFELEKQQKIVLENELCAFLQLPQKVLVGSGVIVPKAHRETVFDLTEQEWQATYELLHNVKSYLDTTFTPDGYNVGWNVGSTGGQHIPHAHLHVIPRFNDEPYAGKGIRHWLKQKSNGHNI